MNDAARSLVATWALVGAVVIACGSEDDAPGADPNDGGASSSSSSSSSSGSSSSGGEGGAKDAAAGGCPAYTAECGGTCKPIVSDPNNCGGCGKACTAPQVCAGTGCANACLPGTKDCGRACVDTATDNTNCGECGKKCDAGEGCVNGKCHPATKLGPGPGGCAGGGPPISIGTGTASDPCAGALATKTFTWALCSCTNVHFAGEAMIDGFDSTKGTYAPGQLGGGLGFNETLTAPSKFDIWGTMWSSSPNGWASNAGNSFVHYDLHTNGNIKTASFTVDNHARVNGNIEGTPFTIKETLFTPASAMQTGVTFKTKVTGPVNVPKPCACEPKDILDIGAIVAAKKTKNDNATIGLAANALDKPNAHVRIDLPCGHYYFDRIDLLNSATIVAHGRTAIYVGGDIITGGALQMQPVPGGELDVVVGGTIKTPSGLKIGSANYPALTRVYVGGTEGINFSSDIVIGANIYAPNAQILWASTSDIFGAVFAKDFKSNSRLNIHYDRAVVGTAASCPPPGGGGGGGADGGPGSSGCGSCRDCNNQACINGKCDACTDSSQCCAPLICVSGACISPIR